MKTRVVAATNKDLSVLIADGNFREDLYFRLAVVKIEIPSLNERRDDILPIAKHFLLEFSEKFNKTFTSIDAEAEDGLKQFLWTGNVRELKNLIERGVLLADGPTLKLEHLGFETRGNGNGHHDDQKLPLISMNGIDFPGVLEGIEKEYFEEALKLANGNESKAAHLLKMTRDKFRYRRQKLAIQ
jgi:DNA-binding NtrC family response regulator